MAYDDEPTVFGAPPPSPELQRLQPLVGTWTASDHTLDSVLGPGVPMTSKERFTWLEGGYFLVHTYDTVFGDEPAQKGVNYWTYDTQRGLFRIIFFSNNGPYSDDGNQYAGGVADGKLSMAGPARFQYELDGDGKIKVNADGTISVVWLLRDGTDWSPWMTNTFTKMGD